MDSMNIEDLPEKVQKVIWKMQSHSRLTTKSHPNSCADYMPRSIAHAGLFHQLSGDGCHNVHCKLY
eukprot:2532483-Amphidinium_carterae.1